MNFYSDSFPNERLKIALFKVEKIPIELDHDPTIL